MAGWFSLRSVAQTAVYRSDVWVCMRRCCSTVCLAMIILDSVLWAQDKQFLEDWARGANSPGSALTLKETGRKSVDGRTVVSYRLFASGLPKSQHLTLWTWNLGSGPQGVADAFVNGEGLIVNRLADPAHKTSEDPIDFRVVAGRAEPKRVALTSDDGTLRAFATAIPFPLEQMSGECRLSVEMAAPNYASVVLHGSGFQPGDACGRIRFRIRRWQAANECDVDWHIYHSDSSDRQRAKSRDGKHGPYQL